MISNDEFLNSIDTAIVLIDRASAKIVACHGTLVGVAEEALIGRDWHDALGVCADNTAVINEAVSSGVAATLPPIALVWGTEGEIAVAGMIAPQRYRGRDTSVLFLRRLTAPDDLDSRDCISPSDIVAVLGVDHLVYSPTWGVPETDRLMMDLRASLQQILRDIDYLSSPAATTITVIFRDLEPQGALDFSRALLSHLHQRLANWESGAQHARVCIGLSQRTAQQSPLAVLLSANGALSQVQFSHDQERIRFSSSWDRLGHTARAVAPNGAFSDPAAIGASHEYLRALVAPPLDQPHGEAWVWQTLALTLAQGGVSTAALLRCEHDGQCVFACAGQMTAAGALKINSADLPKRLQAIAQKLTAESFQGESPLEFVELGVRFFPLLVGSTIIGALLVGSDGSVLPRFEPGVSALQYLGSVLVQNRHWDPQPGPVAAGSRESGRTMEKGIEGYVLDNMEGAIDQAVFLAGVDIPIAVIGASGTGKMYVAQVVQREYSGESGELVRIECQTFRNRREAQKKIAKALAESEGKTLVFKSPQLLHLETQARLARQLSSRTISDNKGTRYLPGAKYVGLFPENPEVLVRRGQLDERLASVFGGYPIEVPPLRLRGRAVLRWAHKILEQEGTRRDRRVLGFTPDAEQAMLHHAWPGNISEMRELISAGLDRTDKEWVTPVDLGLFLGISADGTSTPARDRPFLEKPKELSQVDDYTPSALEALRLALGQALATSLETANPKPLGAWLDDEIILAACERFEHNDRATAGFLQTRVRNIGRWMPRLLRRDAERSASLLWQEVRQCVQHWIQQSNFVDAAPQQLAQTLLMSLVIQQCEGVSPSERARIMGVSTPTYQKRLKQLQEH